MDLRFDAEVTRKLKWSSDSVRDMCIDHDFYTKGSVEDYSKMLNYVDCKAPTDAVLYIVAKDIVKHSDLSCYGQSDLENISSIMFELNRTCVTTFFDVK